MPTLEDFNEVAESLFKGGTRYRSEKIAVISVYLFIVTASFVWAFSGIELGSTLKGEFEAQNIKNIDDQNFVVRNSSSSVWRDVRIVINGRYVAEIAKLKADQTMRLSPEDFRYYYFVPRPWGSREWERVSSQPKPAETAPGDVDVKDLTIQTRGGRVDVSRKSGS